MEGSQNDNRQHGNKESEMVVERLKEMEKILEKMISFDHKEFKTSSEYLKAADIKYTDVVCLYASVKFMLNGE
jgi:hypothetical protein